MFNSFAKGIVGHSIEFLAVLLLVHQRGAAARVVLRRYGILGALLLILLTTASFCISWPLAYSLPNLADDDGAASNVLALVEARRHLPRHVLLLFKLLLIRQHRIGRTIWIGVDRMYASVRRLLPSLTPSHLLHLHSTWIDWLLLHHLW